MVTFPNAKINLGLNILAKRDDGFHDIASVFYPVAWADVLEILPAADFSFSSSGLPIPGAQDGNLVIKAFQILQQAGLLVSKNVGIHLHKVLPMGAGIGGGSADGAFALRMFNEIFSLKLSTMELQTFAAQMGSDCPFFIENIPKFCYGRGTDFEAIDLNLKGKYILMVNPEIHVSTAEAYAGVKPRQPVDDIRDIIRKPIETWQGMLVNDFEASVLQKYPKISQVKEELYKMGAGYASMTGSGSTVYGIFEKMPVWDVNTFTGCICWAGDL